jgi:hypothetical protein
MGCLFALFAGVFPRLAVFILWVARPERVDAAFSTFLWPLLGIIFLPFATLIYLLLYTPGRGLSGWDWFWGHSGRAAGHRALGGQRHPAQPDPRQTRLPSLGASRPAGVGVANQVGVHAKPQVGTV